MSQTLGYLEGENSFDTENATGRVGSLTSKVGTTTTGYSYTYDDRGNITAIRVDGVLKYSYEYDNLNQLVRENNAVANKTYVYTYDDAGNILYKRTYAYTTGTLGTVQSTYSYTYGNSQWGDQLTAYRGTTITYDSLGNPLSYYNGNSYTFTWTKGRQLASTVKGGITTTYTYNADGIRIGKNVGGTAVEYVISGSRIVAEKNGSNIIRYLYDAQGLPVGMILNSTVYLYEKNLQGDIVGVYTTSGTRVASYTYDAWGKLVSSSYTDYTVFNLNPFRYRGYYYDSESGFYYLQSRYYDPATGRFLNADGYVNANGDLQGFNMYAYCSNNPVMCVDYTGELICTTAIYNDGAKAYQSVYLSIPIFDHLYEIGTYSELRKLAAGNPFVQVHHIIGVRFGDHGFFPNLNLNKYCIILPKEYHQIITNETRTLFAYGSQNYTDLTDEKIVQGLNDIYNKKPLPMKGGNTTPSSRIVIGFRNGSYTVSVVSGPFDSDIEDDTSCLE